MEAIRLIPVISMAGAVVGIAACFMPWIGNISGVDLFNAYGSDFQAYMPIIVLILSALSVGFSILILRDMRFWYVPYLQFFFGVAIMVVSSIFAMWIIDGVKVASIASTGYWMSYLAGILMIIGCAVYHLAVIRKFGKARNF